MPVFVGRAHCAISRTIPLGLPQAPTHGAAQIVPYSGLDADPLEKYREKIQKLLDEMVRYKLEHYLKNHYRLPNPPTNAYKLTDTQYQRILKEYLTASSAVDSFTSNGVFVKNALNDVYRFLAFCAVVSGIIIGGAVGYSYWGGQVSPLVDQLTSANFFGWPKTEVHTCHMFNVDSSSMEALTNATIVTTLVDLDGVLLAKNLYCGLMLGLVFGFLDNLGLFFGMSNLDPIFYKFGTNVISGAIERNRAAYGNDEAALLSDDSKEQLVKIHDAANDLMAGLGNTFSDIIGVIIGTAALVIAKAGLGVDPGFWPLDIIAMLLGCLLGAFLPAFAAHANTIGGPKREPFVFYVSWGTMALLGLSILVAGIPETNYKEDWSFVLSLTLLTICIAALLFLMIIVPLSSTIGASRVKYLQEYKIRP